MPLNFNFYHSFTTIFSVWSLKNHRSNGRNGNCCDRMSGFHGSRCEWRSTGKTIRWTRNRFVEKNLLLRQSRWIYTLLELLLYCEPCLEGFQTVIIKKVLIDFLQVIVKSSSLPKLCNTRFTYIGRSTMNNKLKRTDFFENFKLSTTLNEIFVVVVQNRWKTQHTITDALVDMFDLSMENRVEFIPHKLSWVFREDSQSELILTMPTVKKPIRVRSPNSGETAGFWNTIRNGVTQTSLFRVKQRK